MYNEGRLFLEVKLKNVSNFKKAGLRIPEKKKVQRRFHADYMLRIDESKIKAWNCFHLAGSCKLKKKLLVMLFIIFTDSS